MHYDNGAYDLSPCISTGCHSTKECPEPVLLVLRLNDNTCVASYEKQLITTTCIFFLLIRRHTAHWCPMLLSLASFPCHCVFQSSFCSCVIGFLLCFCTHSLDPLFLTPGEFQALDWLQYPLTCGPRGKVGMHMEQKSQCKLLPWLWFEPRTSCCAVQHATTRPLHATSHRSVVC